jgi:hypothetical protein
MRVLPSAVVEFIDNVFPFAQDPDQKPPSFDGTHATQIGGLADILDAVPPELLALPQQHLIGYIGAIGMIRTSLRMFEARVTDWKLKGENIRVVRNLLTRCPDDLPAATVTELTFIDDDELRRELRHDISRATNAMTNADWKTATVLAGSVVEALLLWALRQEPPESVKNAAAALHADQTFDRKPPTDLDEWTLHHYAEVAGRLRVVSNDTLTQVRLTKGFRNLIHPGRSIRLARKCDRGTALAALAAVEMVVTSISSGASPEQS